MKVLLSAYACEPGRGSEPGAGWEFAAAAAREHEVWLLTRPHRIREIREAAAHEGISKMNVVPIEVPRFVVRFGKRGRGVLRYIGYVVWQRRASRTGRQLILSNSIDVAHHVTFASDWLPCGLARLPRSVPLVWGPVGGASPTMAGLWPMLGWRNAFKEAARQVGPGWLGDVTRSRVARRAAVVIALNEYVRKKLEKYAANVVVEPNAVVVPTEKPAVLRGGQRRRALFVGRLLGWKGIYLAIRALADERCGDWVLDVYGSGLERDRAKRLSHDLGVSHRVGFHGDVSHDEVLLAMSEADVLLFPSMHDSAPWTVAEALSVGLPVIALDACGPPTLIKLTGSTNSFVVEPRSGGVVARLSDALVQVGSRDLPSSRFCRERLPVLLTAVYEQAVGHDMRRIYDRRN